MEAGKTAEAANVARAAEVADASRASELAGLTRATEGADLARATKAANTAEVASDAARAGDVSEVGARASDAVAATRETKLAEIRPAEYPQKGIREIGPEGQDLLFDETEAREVGSMRTEEDLGQRQGREFRQEELKASEFDPKQPSHVRGWLRNERRRVSQPGRNNKDVRNPQGMVMAHGRQTPAREGYDYSNSRLQDIELNKLEERVRLRAGKP